MHYLAGFASQAVFHNIVLGIVTENLDTPEKVDNYFSTTEETENVFFHKSVAQTEGETLASELGVSMLAKEQFFWTDTVTKTNTPRALRRRSACAARARRG